MVGYMKLHVDWNMNCGDCWLQYGISRQNHDMWLTVSYMKLLVDKDMNSGDIC